MCTSLADYPMGADRQVVALINGEIESCGGLNEAALSTGECYKYDLGSNSWTRTLDLTEPRQSSASSVIGNIEWFITGGEDDISTTEIRVDGISLPGPMLPNAGMRRGCQVTLNETHVFLADSEDKTTFTLNWGDKTWSYQVIVLGHNIAMRVYCYVIKFAYSYLFYIRIH